MPRATTQKFHRVHPVSITSTKGKEKEKDSSQDKSEGSRATNPIFNTARYGQHILKNPQAAQGIVDKASLRPTDYVLEIGPGTGNLSVRILAAPVKHLHAIEADPRLASELLKRLQSQTPPIGNIKEKVTLQIADAIKAHKESKWPDRFDVCISNTPYQISSPLVFGLLEHAQVHRPPWRIAVLTFQREFALRLCANPGTTMWSRLSANVQLYAKVALVGNIARTSFRPPPQVETSIVRMEPYDPPPPIKFEEIDGLNRIIFARPNRTVRANFTARGVAEMCERNWKTWCAERDKMIDDSKPFSELLDATLISSEYAEARSSKMGINDILKLLKALHDVGIHFA